MMTMPDGNIYGIPSVDSGGEGHGMVSYKLWMNTNWLDAVGMAVPTTTDEFRAVLEAFKTKDPNGNGTADEIPLTGAINTWAAEPYLYILNAFGYFDTNYYYLKNDKINPILNQDYLKEGLKYVAGLAADGLIDPAAFTQDIEQMGTIGNNEGVAIAGAVTCGHIGMFTSINDVERCSQYDNIPPVAGPSGYRAIPYVKMSTVSGAAFVITDKCANPEVAIKFADLFCSEEWSVYAQVGAKGKNWDDPDAGTFGMDGTTPAKYKYLKFETETDVTLKDESWGWAMRLIEPNWKNLFQVVGDINDPTNYEAKLYRNTIKLFEYAADVDTMMPLMYSEDDSAKLSQMQTAIGDFAKSAIVEFITGKRDIDSGWDAYLADLDRLQYNDMLALIQKNYDAR